MLRIVNNITGAVLGAALLCGVLWLRLSHISQEVIFGYFTRSNTANAPQANDSLLIYPIIGLFVGAVLADVVVLMTYRYNKRCAAMGAKTIDTTWIILAIVTLSVAGGAVYGHNFG